ncbi:hypothetical protein RclHR1_00190033 [Rhizophagus clarus]|uniref:Uncharacterized protein n=1 Tax=Rhizophagus clarus TaxID=94130 RepID=A0A2Z6QNK1_9GLOM|nr:hypothetical protein RclHR1_00190033 [Rhizophagus clarus]GES90329.1 hypothetical protein GLOIN_2v341513 [Rhizophagus clarus]
MLRSVLGGIRKQGQKKTVIWSPDVEDNSKPLPDLPREGMTDDEALKKSDEKSVSRRARRQHAYATINPDFAQTGASSSKANYNRKANFSFKKPTITNFNFTPSNNKSFNFAVQNPESAKKFWFGTPDNDNFIDQSNANQQAMFNVEELINEQKTRIRNKNMDQVNGFMGQQSAKSVTNGKFNTFSNSEGHRAFGFDTQSSENDSNIGQENKMDPLSDFAVDQAAQISKLTEDEKKRNRTLRFAQSSQNKKPQKIKSGNMKSQELEQLGIRVNDFVDTTMLYAQVQDAIISKTSNEAPNLSGRTRAWDYFDDGLKSMLKNETRVESKVESLITYHEIPQVLDNIEEDNKSGLKFGSDLIHESDEPHDVDMTMAQVIEDFPSVPIIPLSNQIIKTSEVTSVQYEEEPTQNRNNDNEIVGNDTLEKSDTPENLNIDIEEKEKEKEKEVEEEVEEEEEKEEEEEIDPAFRFTTICDLRDEVFRSSPPQSRREFSLKRKAAFKRAPAKIKNKSKYESEHSRRRKYRLAIFDANRANSITKVLNELDSTVDLDSPAERLLRLEHPEYFPIEPSVSREERLYEYERARSDYETYLAKLMAKQKSRQEKVVQKRLREMENEELLREAKKVARQKIQEEMGWTPPSDAVILNWRQQRGRLLPTEDEVYDEKESDEENIETYYNTFEELSNISTTLRLSSIRRSKVLSYSELRRRVRERERSKKAQAELAKMQETARKCQIEDLRHKILEEERVHKRQKLVDLSNERDRRDAKTIQHIREVATSKIAIGRAIRELEDKIAATEAELNQKRRFEDMVNEQSVYMKCIREEELQRGTVM